LLLRVHGPCHGEPVSALISLAINGMPLPFAHRHNQHQHLAIAHLIDQAKPSGAQLDLVAIP
jgi:hypothetical protein